MYEHVLDATNPEPEGGRVVCDGFCAEACAGFMAGFSTVSGFCAEAGAWFRSGSCDILHEEEFLLTFGGMIWIDCVVCIQMKRAGAYE